MKSILLLVLAVGVASAQNSDLGLLIGISGPSSQTITSSRITSDVGASLRLPFPGHAFRDVFDAIEPFDGGVGEVELDAKLLLQKADELESGERIENAAGLKGSVIAKVLGRFTGQKF